MSKLWCASVLVLLTACTGWEPTRPFERRSAAVDRAIEKVGRGDYESAEEVLTEFLDTGPCEKGKLNVTDRVRKKPDGSFDLALVLFSLGEQFGDPFGQEPKPTSVESETPEALLERQKVLESRSLEIKCGLLIAIAVAKDPRVELSLRARAYFLAGNMEFLRLDYKAAIAAYQEALRLIPGSDEREQADDIGRDAAFNRAVALRRLEELEEAAKKQQKPEEPKNGEGDKPPEPPPGDQPDQGQPKDPGEQEPGGGAPPPEPAPDGKDPGRREPEPGNEEPKAPDQGPNGAAPDGAEPAPEPSAPGGAEPAEPQQGTPVKPMPIPKDPQAQGSDSREQGDRILDRFDQSPSYQQEEAKKRAEGRRRMEDK